MPDFAEFYRQKLLTIGWICLNPDPRERRWYIEEREWWARSPTSVGLGLARFPEDAWAVHPTADELGQAGVVAYEPTFEDAMGRIAALVLTEE